ncbi:MAG: sodium:solute symporter, partial [Pseudomonadota bacterium]
VAQEALSRTLAAKSPAVAQKGAYLASALYLVIGLIPVFIGLVAGTDYDFTLGHRDQFLPRLAQDILNPFCFVIFVGALLSAILSILESSLLTAAALMAHNILVPLFPKITESQKVASARVFVVISGFLAYFIATSSDTIFGLASASASFGSAGILVTTLFGLWFYKGSAITALATLFMGITATLLGEYYFEWEATFIFSLILCLCTYILGLLIESLIERIRIKRSQDVARSIPTLNTIL